MRKDSHRKKLDRLTDALVDDILQTPDAEIFSETVAEGKSVQAEVDRMRTLLKGAEILIAKNRLVAAKEAVARQKETDQKTKGKVVQLSPAGARQALASVLQRHPESAQEFTLAARKGKDLSDSDVMSMLEDLRELGLYAPDAESEE
ncbi:MAG: hypothetical protein AB7F61_18720 [Desulfobulbus sp.]|jgi:hypothetical protein